MGWYIAKIHLTYGFQKYVRKDIAEVQEVYLCNPNIVSISVQDLSRNIANVEQA